MLMGDMMQELEEFWLNWSPQGLLELEPATSVKLASCTFSDCEFSVKPSDVLCSLFIFICPEGIWRSIHTTRCRLYQLWTHAHQRKRGSVVFYGLVMCTT